MGEDAALVKSIFRRWKGKTINSEQLGDVLLSVGASPAILGCMDQLLKTAGFSSNEIEFDKFVDWVFGDEAPQDTVEREALPENSVRSIFSALDKDNSGFIDAEELTNALLDFDHCELTDEDIVSVLREVDLDGDGTISLDELEKLLEAPSQPAPDFQPHLVLYFDINQTVLMADSVTSAGAKAMLNEVVANAAWGREVQDGNGKDGNVSPKRWELVSTSPELLRPEEGLQTYCHFMRHGSGSIVTPKGDQRRLLRTFTEPGQPGEKLAQDVEGLLRAMELPASVTAEADPSLLQELGLGDGKILLLPSFLILIRWLKTRSRSFSLCFRTFGMDLCKIAREFNALCENRHPLFAGGADWVGKSQDFQDIRADVVLDGSDGAPDMRLDLAPGGSHCGTWVRGSDGLHLVFGDLRQPPPAQSTAAELKAFYANPASFDRSVSQMGFGGCCEVDIVCGEEAVRDRLRQMLHRRADGRTMALRDYYPAWDACGRRAKGGKPLFLESKDTSVLQVFFDDHVLPKDAHIVDIRHADCLSRHALPIGAVFGVHVVRAEPISAITEPSYFIKSVQAAEERWRAACRRRGLLADALRSASCRPPSPYRPASPQMRYTAHKSLREVALATDINAADDEDS